MSLKERDQTKFEAMLTVGLEQAESDFLIKGYEAFIDLVDHVCIVLGYAE